MSIDDWHKATLIAREERHRKTDKQKNFIQAVYEIEMFLASDEGFAALELLDAARSCIQLNKTSTTSSRWLSESGFQGGVRDVQAWPVSIEQAISAATERTQGLVKGQPKDVLPYIITQLDELARRYLKTLEV